MRAARGPWAVVTAGTAALALMLAGCGSEAPEPSGGASVGTEPVTLTITTFGTMGLDKLYAKYEEAHPNMTIKAHQHRHRRQRPHRLEDQAGGRRGLPDVQAVEEGWLGQVMKVSDSFTDLASTAPTRSRTAG